MPTIKEQIDRDLKTALLGGDKPKAEVLRGLKSVVLYAEVAAGTRDSGGLEDDAIIVLFAKESKKRQESADLYISGGSQEKADKELSEKAIIDGYLPKQLGEAELQQLVASVAGDIGATGPQQMGQLIGAVKARAGAAADGATVARLAKAHLAASNAGNVDAGGGQ
ncbi:MAG TPA: GatB/YqeY domain-containing protein [Candidatus Saccharimonadales bacterium]|jgi:hypothetical protein